MKTYKKPITEVHDIEVIVMQATSPGPGLITDPEKGVGDNNDVLGKETSFSASSLWDGGEEE